MKTHRPISSNLMVLVILFVTAMLNQACQKEIQTEKSPNIIFILADDLGYGDIGVLYQNQRKAEGKPAHQTPQLDEMANEGMLLTRHYVPAPVCAPSRASLLRGVNQGNAEVRNNQFDKALPDNHTLASVLKEAEYNTAIIGKYGLQGREGKDPETWEAYPTKRGFDYFFGYVRHVYGHNHYPAHEARERPPMKVYDGNEEISSRLKGCYTTDLFTAVAKKWIADQIKNDTAKPFFLYLAFDTPHAGLQVASAPYPEAGGMNGGVQLIGEPDNYINTVTDTIDSYYHPDYANTDWPDSQKRFASMVRRIDNAVGDIFQLLKDLEIDKKTFVVFSSDNGPHDESYGYGDYAPNFFESYGNMDGIKRDTWEGGIRVPAITRWPGKIAAGTKNDTPTGFHDWLATFAQLANLPAPAITDGISLVPLLKGEESSVQNKIYIEYNVYGETPSYDSFDESHKGQKRGEMQVIYLDGYKGVRYNILSAEDDFRIYDTQKDPGEVNNLAGTSQYLNELQTKMKDKVLQMRTINSSAPRLYDSIPIPAVKADNFKNGLTYKLFNMESPWVPDISSIKEEANETGTIDNFDVSIGKNADNFVVEFTGFLSVPQTGKYQFNLNTTGGAVLRLHEAAVIDADKPYNPGTTAKSSVLLQKGYHPIKLTYKKNTNTKSNFQLTWATSKFSEKPIDTDNLFH